MKLEHIPGNEYAKRAIEVALVQENSIRFTGGKTAENLATWAETRGLHSSAVQPCICGNLGSSKKACTCTPSQRVRHLSKINAEQFDVEMEVKDQPDKVYKLLVGELKQEKEEEMLKRVIQAKKRIKTIKTKLDEDTKQLLKVAIDKMNLDFYQAKTALKLALSIASLSGYSKIRNIHLGEALQYLKHTAH